MTSSLSSTSTEVLCLHNVALALFQKGKLDRCGSLLTEALRLFHHSVRGAGTYATKAEITQVDDETSAKNPDEPSHLNSTHSKTVFQQVRLVALFASIDQIASPSNLFSVYNHVFTIAVPSTTLTTSLPTEEQRNVLLVVILYKLGFALHRQGLFYRKDSLLRKALQLYKAAHKFLQEVPADVNNHFHDNLLKLLRVDLSGRSVLRVLKEKQ